MVYPMITIQTFDIGDDITADLKVVLAVDDP